MQRAVAFAKDIATSKHIADLFPRVVTAYQESLNKQENEGHPVEGTNRDLACEVHHVDGTFNALERNAELAWLKSPVAEGECRILTNARCLSEGVDVPGARVMASRYTGTARHRGRNRTAKAATAHGVTAHPHPSLRRRDKATEAAAIHGITAHPHR
jgi:hypothetical protein